MNAMWRNIDALFHVGAARLDNDDVSRRIWLTNAAGVLATLTSAVFVPLHYASGAPTRALLLVLAFLTFASVPLLGWLGRTTVARLVLVFAVNFNVLAMQATDAGSHVWVCFIPIACAAMLVFSHAERHVGWMGALVSVGLTLLTLGGWLDGVSAWMGQPPIPPAIDMAVVALGLFMTPVIIAMLNLQVSRHDDIQAAARRDLETEVQRGQELADRLREASAVAREASIAKSAFLANMSHEIRTPLAAVISLTDMARDAADTQRDEYLDLASGSAHHLLRILNDILDLSKVEAGKLVLERTSTDLHALVEGVAALSRVRADEKGLRVLVEVSLAGESWRLLDSVRLKQVLMNLIGNALKFTEAGSVTLTARAEGERVRFEVVDSGIGMTDEQLARVFEPFHQAEDSTTRRFGGTGLGLTICRHILELWGSELEVSSTPGEGTRMAFTLELPPSVPVEDPTSFPSGGVAPGTLRILVAEDNSVNQLIARRVLEQLGHEVEVVADGARAVEVAFDGFDAILMDLQMPELDGREATTRIRELEEASGRARLPIIALTANAMSGEDALCRAAGMDAYLTKPVIPAALQQALGALVQQRQAS